MKKHVSFLVLAGFICAPLFAQGLSTPMATVKLTKPEIISEKQFNEKASRQEKAMGRTLTSEERKALLDALIDEMLFLQLCDRDGIRVSDAEIDAAIAQMRAQLGENVSDEQFSAYLSSQGAKIGRAHV